MLNEEYPKTRAEAKQLGVKKYFTGKPCKNGHVEVRLVLNGWCCACGREASNAYRDRCREDRTIKTWRDKNPKHFWVCTQIYRTRVRAVEKKIPFDLTVEYVKSICPDKCPVFETPFNFIGNKHLIPESPSIDRIDPAKGYVEGNIAIISAKANQIKSAYKFQDIYKVAAWLESIGH